MCFASCDYNPAAAAMHLRHFAYWPIIMIQFACYLCNCYSHFPARHEASTAVAPKGLTSVHPDSVEGYFLATFTPPFLPQRHSQTVRRLVIGNDGNGGGGRRRGGVGGAKRAPRLTPTLPSHARSLAECFRQLAVSHSLTIFRKERGCG